MTGKLFLHLGSPKTGTTFLQGLLWQQRDLAKQQGLLLPGQAFADHFFATLDVRELADQPNSPGQAAGMWERLIKQATSWRGNALISHELFAGVTADQARAARAVIADNVELHLVLTARDWYRQIPAEWQEHVKHRYPHGLDHFVDEIRHPHPDNWFWRVQDYPHVLSRWGWDLPAERMHVVTVPPKGAAPTLLWERFAELLELDAAAFVTDSARDNTSLGRPQAELLRRVNQALGERLPIPGPYPRVAKEILAHHILASHSGAPVQVDQLTAKFAREQSERIVAELKALNVNVIGDLGELVPDVSQVPDVPELPNTEQLLAEATQTIADLLVELAQRTRPQQPRSLPRRAVGKIKRTLRGAAS